MADESVNSTSLTIRCPACRQRFDVDNALVGRMVECGGCDARFRIDDEVVVRSRKFYPGERAGSGLNNFQRVPLSAAAPAGLQTMRYAELQNPEKLEPASAQRILAGVFGVAMMALTALLLIFAGGPGGAFDSMPVRNRLIVAGFVSLLGTTLLVYANPRARIKAGTIGLLLSAGVICLPFFFKGGTLPAIAKTAAIKNEPLFPVEDELDSLTALKERFTTKPLEDEQKGLEKSGEGKKAIGVFLIGLQPRNLYMIRDYLIRDSEAEPSSHPYPRDEGSYLMVLTGVTKSLDDVAEIAAKLGRTEEVHPEIGLIVVRVNNELFVAGAAEKLNNKKDPAFYELNMRELDSIDLDRVKRAVERLADAEPSIYRTDISRTLTMLMNNGGVKFHDELSRALIVWAEEPGPAGEAALKVLEKYNSEETTVPESLVALIVKEQTIAAIPAINTIWLKNPNLWEVHYKELGSAIEPMVLKQINAKSAPLRRSALQLLAEIGTSKSLSALQNLTDTGNPEVRLLTDRAIESISNR